MVKDLFSKPGLKVSLIKALIFLFALFVLNLVFSRWFTRFDFTQEKRFTLSKTTIHILEGLHSPVTIRVFLEGSFPAPFKRLRKETQEILNEFAAYNPNNIKIRFIDPLEGEEGKPFTKGDSLFKYGIQPTQVELKTKEGSVQKEIFPGALLSTDTRMVGVNLLQNQNQLGGVGGTETLLNNSVEGLEYVLIGAIKKVADQNPPRIGLVSGNGEEFGPSLSDMVKTLKITYRVGKVDLNTFPLDSMVKIPMLIMVKPINRFSEPEKYKLDQYIMHGGHFLAFISNVHAELDSMGRNGMTLGLANDLNLDDFLFRLGVRLNYNLIRDLNCAPIPLVTGPEGSSSQNLEPWVYYPLVMPAGNNPIVRNLDPVRLQFAGNIDTLGMKGIRKTFLLNSSPYTKLASTPVQISLTEVSDPAEHPNEYKGGIQNVAVLLEGNFHSSFQNRTVEGIDRSLPFVSNSLQTGLIIVSDGDLPLNQVNSLEKTIYPLGYDKYSRQVFGNKVFLENAVDYLIDPNGLIQLRSKEIKLRLLNKPLVQETKGTETFLNFLVPILWVLLSGFAFSGFRAYRYSRFGK